MPNKSILSNLLRDLFQSCMLHPYILGLDRIGVTIFPGKFKIYTSRFNRWFHKIATVKSRLTRIWFTMGSIFGVVAIIPSILILLITVYNNISMPQGTAYNDQQIMVAVVRMVHLQLSLSRLFLIFKAYLLADTRSQPAGVATCILLCCIAGLQCVSRAWARRRRLQVCPLILLISFT